jgi:hypothetical protein
MRRRLVASSVGRGVQMRSRAGRGGRDGECGGMRGCVKGVDFVSCG